VKLIAGDCLDELKKLDDSSIQCCVTSPPYWGLRDYNVNGQLGLEETPELYVKKMVNVFREVKRVLRNDGTLWLNLGDSYIGGGRGGQYCKEGTLNYSAYNAGTRYGPPTGKIKGLKPKDLVGIPWRVAFALQADGWYLRSDIIWSKPNPMPESVTDRPTKAHEYIFLLTKASKYYYDIDAIREEHATQDELFTRKELNNKGDNGGVHSHLGRNRKEYYHNKGRNKRSVWEVTTKPYTEAHFATFPEDLIKPCILAGSKEGDIILDPFSGAGTTGVVALKYKRDYIGIELNKEYLELSERRIKGTFNPSGQLNLIGDNYL
jgi:DNA modification methylase